MYAKKKMRWCPLESWRDFISTKQPVSLLYKARGFLPIRNFTAICNASLGGHTGFVFHVFVSPIKKKKKSQLFKKS